MSSICCVCVKNRALCPFARQCCSTCMQSEPTRTTAKHRRGCLRNMLETTSQHVVNHRRSIPVHSSALFASPIHSMGKRRSPAYGTTTESALTRAERGARLERDGELARADRVAVLLGALPVQALQQVRVVADLAQDVDPRQRVAPVLRQRPRASPLKAPRSAAEDFCSSAVSCTLSREMAGRDAAAGCHPLGCSNASIP